jgi:ribonuclease VapC
MFVDASGLVAILTEEPDAKELTDRIERADAPITSPVAIFETVAALLRRRGHTVEAVSQTVHDFLKASRIRVEPLTEEIGYRAAAAHATLGKGSGHPARLNLGDCFAYAATKQHGVPLLYKGDDFSRTDLA